MQGSVHVRLCLGLLETRDRVICAVNPEGSTVRPLVQKGNKESMRVVVNLED